MLVSALTAIAGVFGIGLIIGLVVLTTAEEALIAVARTAARDVSGSFWAGVLTQLLAVPVLVVLVIACAITIIGLLAIPFAALAWALALAGAFTLGVLAVALVIGWALAGRGSAGSERSAAVRGLAVGLAALSVVWFGAAVAASLPVAGTLARLVAVAFTWAVATVGMGAVVKSRIGMSRISMHVGRVGSRWTGGWAAPSSTPDPNEVRASPVSWQTPTPVQGVVAARRPVDSTAGTGSGAEL